MNIRGKLPVEPPALAERWWFWTGLGGAITSIVVTSYVVFRPEPERRPLDGGTLDWSVDLR
jgi:hypothetical protein